MGMGMASLELLPIFWLLNTIPVVKIWNFDFGHLSHPPIFAQKYIYIFYDRGQGRTSHIS